ncbi:DUF2627 domain-containing protein [Paenibacillus marinisediminis]
MAKFIAILLLVIPGLLATYGFFIIRDTVFQYIADHGNESIADPSFGWLPFLGGLVLFLFGIIFLGGWIFYRDRKRNYVATRFRKKKGPRPASLGRPAVHNQPELKPVQHDAESGQTPSS